jgi:hypothetical protein
MAGGVTLIGVLAIALFVGFAIIVSIGIRLPWRGFTILLGVFSIALLLCWYFTSLHSELLIGIGVSGVVGMVATTIEQATRSRETRLTPSLGVVCSIALVGYALLPISASIATGQLQATLLPEVLSSADSQYRARSPYTSCEISIWEVSTEQLLANRTSLASARPRWLGGALYGKLPETPYPTDSNALADQDRWLKGLSCSKATQVHVEAIVQALQSPGAYYAASGRSGLIVVPSKKWVVLSYRH